MPPKQKEYPEIVPGGGLILSWQLKGKRVLLVGGGPVAAGEPGPSCLVVDDYGLDIVRGL